MLASAAEWASLDSAWFRAGYAILGAACHSGDAQQSFELKLSFGCSAHPRPPWYMHWSPMLESLGLPCSVIRNFLPRPRLPCILVALPPCPARPRGQAPREPGWDRLGVARGTMDGALCKRSVPPPAVLWTKRSALARLGAGQGRMFSCSGAGPPPTSRRSKDANGPAPDRSSCSGARAPIRPDVFHGGTRCRRPCGYGRDN